MKLDPAFVWQNYAIVTLALFCLVALSTAFSLVFGHLVRRLDVNDVPDGNRKRQAEPVSRLGGVAMLGSLTAMAPLAIFFVDGPVITFHFPLIVLTGTMFLVGLGDDFLTLPSLPKLVLMLAGCVAAAYFGLYPETLQSPFGSVTMDAILIIGSIAWLLVFTNSANFMDGANGLAIGSLAVMLTGLAYIGTIEGSFPLLAVWLTLLGAIIGFLIHNLRGKLYAGDAGSLGLGALFASLGLVSGLQVWTVATLALPFLIDVLMTLIWRAKHGRPWLKPHLDHAYQKLRLSGWSHIETSFLYWGLSTVCAVAAVIAAKSGGDAPFFVFWGLCLSGIALWSIHRRGQSVEI
ncbi:MAG: hypothetical protein AAF296_10820 [Pseudomonadota bacterium]